MTSLLPPEARAVGATIDEGLSLFGKIGSLFSLAWDTLWTVGIMGAIGWFAYQTETGKKYMDQAFEWLASTDLGKQLINFIGKVMEMFGFQHPLKSASVDDITRGMTDASSTPAEIAHARQIAQILQPHWGKKDGLVDKGLVSKEAFSTPEGLKKLLQVLTDEEALKLMHALKQAPRPTDPEKAKANDAFTAKLSEAQKVLQSDANFVKWLADNRPNLSAQLIREQIERSRTQAPVQTAPVQAVPTQPATPETARPESPPAASQTAAPAAPSAQATVLDQLLGKPENSAALVKLMPHLASLPQLQQDAIMATVTTLVNEGKLDLSKKDELVAFFSKEENRKALGGFISALDISSVTDAKTKNALDVLKTHHEALTKVLGDAASVAWMEKKMQEPDSAVSKAFQSSASVMGSYISAETVRGIKQAALKADGAPETVIANIEAIEALKNAATAAATPTTAPQQQSAAPAPKTLAAIETPQWVAEVVSAQKPAAGSTAMTVVNVEKVDPNTAKMVAALVEQQKAASIG